MNEEFEKAINSLAESMPEGVISVTINYSGAHAHISAQDFLEIFGRKAESETTELKGERWIFYSATRGGVRYTACKKEEETA